MQQDRTPDLTRRLDELEREVVRIRAERDAASQEEDGGAEVSRRGFLTKAGAVAVGAGAATLASVMNATPAAATTGTMQYGATNDAGSSDTWLTSTNPDTTQLVLNTGAGTALRGQGVSGSGVQGLSDTTEGVLGESKSGIGVSGLIIGSTGVGVQGKTTGVGSGVYGLATTNGVAVFGDSPSTGTGVQARSTSGIALNVIGTARFSRSGIATIVGTATLPKSSIVVGGVALSSKSIVLATGQKNVAGVWVRAAVPNIGGSSVTIYLNKTVTQSVPVAWMVIEAP